QFSGIGVDVAMVESDGALRIGGVIAHSPAARAGLQINDRITSVDGESVAGHTLEEVLAKMHGAVDAPITLTILRPGHDEPFVVALPAPSVRLREHLAGGLRPHPRRTRRIRACACPETWRPPHVSHRG